MIAAWVGAQALWLKYAYELEFLGKDVRWVVWGFSVLFFLVNLWECFEVSWAYRFERPIAIEGVSGEQKKTE